MRTKQLWLPPFSVVNSSPKATRQARDPNLVHYVICPIYFTDQEASPLYHATVPTLISFKRYYLPGTRGRSRTDRHKTKHDHFPLSHWPLVEKFASPYSPFPWRVMPQVSKDDLPVLIFLLGQRVVYGHSHAGTIQLLRVQKPGVVPFSRRGPAVRGRCPFWSISFLVYSIFSCRLWYLFRRLCTPALRKLASHNVTGAFYRRVVVRVVVPASLFPLQPCAGSSALVGGIGRVRQDTTAEAGPCLLPPQLL